MPFSEDKTGCLVRVPDPRLQTPVFWSLRLPPGETDGILRGPEDPNRGSNTCTARGVHRQRKDAVELTEHPLVAQADWLRGAGE